MHKIITAFQRFYVTIMIAIVGRALVAASRTDEEIRWELSGMPEGSLLRMTVAAGPQFTIQVQQNGTLSLVKGDNLRPDLCIRFKHISLAFLVFSFQEGTARAFANERMVVDGDVSQGIRLIRCLNKMEAIILPRLIARLAVKRYPDISFTEKVSKAARVYGLVARHLILGR